MNWIPELIKLAELNDDNLMAPAVLARGRELWANSTAQGPFLLDGTKRYRSFRQISLITGFSVSAIESAIDTAQLVTDHPLKSMIELGEHKLEYRP